MYTPFLFELRTIIDWISTKTSLNFFEWMRVESIYAKVFQIKCQRSSEEAASLPRGSKVPKTQKILIGGGIFILLICILWFPLVFFAYTPALGISHNPKSAQMTIQIGSFEPIYKNMIVESNIHQFTAEDYHKLRMAYSDNYSALKYLDEFEPQDIVVLQFRSYSSRNWNIPPPSKESFIESMKSYQTKFIHMSLDISRNPIVDVPEMHQIIETKISKEIMRELYEMLMNISENSNVTIPRIFRKFIEIRNQGKFLDIPDLLGDPTEDLVDLNLKLNRDNSTLWWEAYEKCSNKSFNLYSNLPHQNYDKSLSIFIFSEKSYPKSLGVLAVKG